MLPLITAALGLVQQNKQDQENRKRQMEAAAMGQFANSPPAGDKTGSLIGLGNAIGSMVGPNTATPAPLDTGKLRQDLGNMKPSEAVGGPLGDNDQDDLRSRLGMSLLA